MPLVRASRLVHAPVQEVWAAIRDFGTHDRWIEHNPTIVLEGGDGLKVGVKRRVIYADGSAFDEILTCTDDRRWVQEYDVVGELPLPVYDVRGAMRLHPVTADDTTFVERSLQYDTPLARDEAEAFAASRVALLAASLDELAKLFA